MSPIADYTEAVVKTCQLVLQKATDCYIRQSEQGSSTRLLKYNVLTVLSKDNVPLEARFTLHSTDNSQHYVPCHLLHFFLNRVF